MHVNEEQIAFYYQLGRAITQWAHVEHNLSWIVSSCFAEDDVSIALMGFFSIDNFRTKVQFANTIVSKRVAGTEEMARWVELVDTANQLAKKRNRLAHDWLLTVPDAKPGRRLMLLQHRASPSKGKKGRQKYPGALCLRDIVKYQLEFSAFTSALDNFRCRISGQKLQFSKSHEKPKNPPTIAALRRDIYRYANSPPRSDRG